MVYAAGVCCSDASKLDLIYINTYNEIACLRGLRVLRTIRRRKMKRKRVKAGIMVAALIVSALFAGRSTNYVDAKEPDSSKISDNDLSKTTGKVATAMYNYNDPSSAWVCPTNSDYYVNSLYKTDENYKWVSLTDEEREAFRERVEAKNPVDGSDDSLIKYNTRGYDFVGAFTYLAKEVTVVNGSTTTTLPSSFYPIYDYQTYYFMEGRSASGEWKTIFEMYDFSSDYTFSWSDYLSDDFVYFVLTSKEHETDSNTSVKRFFVADDKIDAMNALLTSATVSDVTPSKDEPEVESVMYRLYNPNSGEHFYTADIEEARSLKSGGWKYEGYAWDAPTESSTPVYRVYNPNSGEHHYTKDAAEKDFLVGLGWNDEGIGWYSDDNQGTPLYRLYNPNATGDKEAGGHHYTKDVNEKNRLITAGWRDEGIGWYGI